MAGVGSVPERLGEIQSRAGNKAGEQYVSPERLWLTADGEHIKREGEAGGEFLLVAHGSSIPMDLAVELGLNRSDSMGLPDVPKSDTGLTINAADKTSKVSTKDTAPTATGEVATPMAGAKP